MITDFFPPGPPSDCRSAAHRRLQLQHAREQRERDDAGPWLAAMPDDIVVTIVAQLATSGHVHALQGLIATCRYWRQRLTDCHALWHHLLWLHATRAGPEKGLSVHRRGCACEGACGHPSHYQTFTLGAGRDKRVNAKHPRQELARRMFTRFRTTRAGVVKRAWRRMVSAEYHLATLHRVVTENRQTVHDGQVVRSSFLVATGHPSRRKIPPSMW